MNYINRNIAFLSILILFGCTKDDFTWNVKKRPCFPCSISFYSSYFDYFSKISMAGMSNSTSGTGPNNFYKDKSIKVKKGQIYDLEIDCHTSNYIDSVSVFAYFDWNGDCDFLDSDEKVFISNNINITIVSKSITVPANAVKGDHFARFIVRINSSSDDPCSIGYFSYGEVEDYPLVIE